MTKPPPPRKEKAMSERKVSLSIDRCPHGIVAITLNDMESGHGTRLTQVKCCGRWTEEKRFPLSKSEMIQLADQKYGD